MSQSLPAAVEALPPLPSTPAAGVGHVTPARNANVFKMWWCLACLAFGCVPLLTAHYIELLSKPHYQYTLLVPLAMLALCGRFGLTLQPTTRPLGLTVLFFLALGGAGLAAAGVIWSPWLGAVSSLLLIIPGLLWYGGKEGWTAGARAWVFSWTLIPLPFSIDDDLTTRLKTVSTKLTSRILDEFGVLHLSYANVIELPEKQLFVADACSGIHSLFVLLAAALFLAMWLKRTALHTVCLLISAFGIVLLENISRLVIVAVGIGYRIDLSEGWRHMTLGLVLFCLSVVLILSADQFLMFLLPRGWMWRARSRRDSARPTVPTPGSPGRWTLAACVACAFVVLGAVHLRAMPRLEVNRVFVPALTLPRFGADALPDNLAGFEFVEYATVNRVPGDPLGRDSQQWTFRRGKLTVLLSLDSPYEGIHDLCVCYTATGWTIPDKRVIPAQDLSGLNPKISGPVAIATLQRPLYGHGLLLFSLFDQSGDVGAMIRELERGDSTARGLSRLNSVRTPSTAPVKTPQLPYIQVQAFARSDAPLSEDQIQEVLALYLAGRDVFHQRCLADAPLASAAASNP